MSKITSVAKWEYLEKVKSKAFLIGLFLTPMLMIVMGVLPSLFMAQEDTSTKVVGVIDPTGDLAGPLIREMQSRYQLANGQPNYLVRPLAVGKGINVQSAISDADRMAVSDEIEGYCVIGGQGSGDSVAEYRSKAIGDLRLIGRLEETLKSVMTEKRAMTLGIAPSVVRELNVKLDLRPVKLSKAGEEEGGFERVFFSAYVFLMALFLLIITSGQMLVRSILEEKSNRIVEVLVSSCSSTELMAGKVLGLSALGLTQMGFWAVIGVAVTIQFGVSLVSPGVA
ncbi:MAG TPA: ABC transporter permease, partial [Bacteroidota bacterium]|nr:ABC transporter permease [Bacteroidota bacterium]